MAFGWIVTALGVVVGLIGWYLLPFALGYGILGFGLGWIVLGLLEMLRGPVRVR